MRAVFRCASLAVLSLVLATGCTTPYGPRGLAGGYVETRLADDTYVVAFHGNGNTSGDMVWRYWIYRCAELTLQRGYEFFTVATAKTATSPAGNTPKLMALDELEDDAPPLPDTFKGGGGGGSHSVYIPGTSGGTVTTWHASATIRMFRNTNEVGATYALRARAVVEILKPYVVNQGRGSALSKEELIERTIATPPPEAAASAAARRREPVQMKDLDGLIHQ